MSTCLIHLPPELLEQILSGLPNSDIKSLRLTCTRLHRCAQLRLSRIFLSPNPLNVSVFRAVADHEEFRKGIVEIIYDDARLDDSHETPNNEPYEDYDEYYEDYDEDEEDIGDVHSVPIWFRRIYSDNYDVVKNYGCEDVKKPHHLEVLERFKEPVSPAESYKLYQKLVQEQEHVIATNSDAEALKYGLPRFPNLRTITLTPVAHGQPHRPFYPTPMIRSLPRGLIYPIPRGWPVAEEQSNRPYAKSWDGEEKAKWRGFCLVTQAVAQHQRENPGAGISEFIVDSNQLLTGINCRVFDEAENSEYRDLVTILARPGFSRIDLSLHVGGQDHEGWPSFRSGLLQHALGTAQGLRHVSLTTNLAIPNELWDASEGGQEHHLPLRTLFPIDTWSNLQHFCLSRFLVNQADVMDFLLAMPLTLRSVELSFLWFLPKNGHYQSLLEQMRDELDWRGRVTAARPKIVIRIDNEPIVQGLAICVGHEVEDFMYSDGENPFRKGRIFQGRGTHVKAFDPEYTRPFAKYSQLVELGILEKPIWYQQN
ncbi:uncharacterized protein NECHADRAFT_42016 [Fusarium vanettenii 77-13-4]|uniref:F-box domain-containing protein n=1 Tax=Fusarium vanettenii (strain ATCC MYA-4622 / CBS 123669 / FGSC 9596 / NRRL 45880 / 77-13-4) TaxID=660122 RepID=C7ZGN5_FUSV7|nr:uncharacterized protein NECHADRAFT_42016 [Fusarium vanettenii 77-13-4]EEU36944.1 hypothetical protein NECHADRAFT_42016 [Fusarium vanettenii 77-13-4]